MATTKKPADPMKVITGRVRFSYAHVFKPQAIEEGADPKYSCSLLIPKTDKVTLKKIQDAINAAKEAGLPLWGGSIPAKNFKLPLRDGDDEYPNDPAYEGMYFLSANSPTKPGVVDANLDPILSPDEFYSGCYGRASVRLFPFAKAGNKGIGVGLNNLQKLEDGENLGGGNSTPEEDFGEDDDLLS